MVNTTKAINTLYRFLAIVLASGFCNTDKHLGSRIILGSANKLYKNPSISYPNNNNEVFLSTNKQFNNTPTPSPFPGPPKFIKRTPTLEPVDTTTFNNKIEATNEIDRKNDIICQRSMQLTIKLYTEAVHYPVNTLQGNYQCQNTRKQSLYKHSRQKAEYLLKTDLHK